MFALLHLLCPSVKVSSPLSYQTLHYYSLILNPDEYPRLVPFVFLGSAREPHRKNGDRPAPWAPQGSLQAVSQSNPSSAAQGRIRGNRFPPGLISRKLGLENSFEITQPRQMLQAAYLTPRGGQVFSLKTLVDFKNTKFPVHFHSVLSSFPSNLAGWHRDRVPKTDWV